MGMEVDGDVPSVWVITGVMAAGKSTIAELLARRFERAVHLRGDVFRKMIVSGRDPIEAPLDPEARRQLALRRRLACDAANLYWRERFTVVLQDIYLGNELTQVVAALQVTPLHVVVLAPRPDVVVDRERGREKTGYTDWEVAELCAALDRETPRIGLWVDSSELSPDETVAFLLEHQLEARVA